MEAALLEFELDSSTQNVSSFYAGYAKTHHYLTREAVCSALTYADRIWQDKSEEYRPLYFPFTSTPAEPVQIHTREVIYKAGDEQDKGLLRFGKQEVLLPGSRFRCAVWGELPELSIGQVFLIGKKRAPARVVNLTVDNVEPDYSTEGATLPVQVSPQSLKAYRAFVPLVGTMRYLIVRVALTANLPRFRIGDYVVPFVGDSDE